jgi:sigma-B regulation protein RsbU (phosphoserine phosphatase)
MSQPTLARAAVDASPVAGVAGAPAVLARAGGAASAGLPFAEAHQQQSSRPLTVLVVDDDEANRESLARRLQRRGYQTAVAPGGAEALAYIAQHEQLDLVLLDVMMPGVSGLDVLQRVREVHSSARLPIIMATAKDASGDIVKAFELGANDYVVKPLDFAVVVARVQTHIAMKRSIEQIVDLETRLNERNHELELVNDQLTAAATRARHELATAAKVQETFLPQALPQFPGATFAWVFKPCQELAGDSLNVCGLDGEHVAMYVLDVAGHGVAASLLAVAANRALSPVGGPQQSLLLSGAGMGAAGGGGGGGGPGGAAVALQPTPPAEVAAELSRRFAWNDSTGQFLTMFYAVLNTRTRLLTYTSAGHPGAVRVAAGGACSVISGNGLPIGIGETYEQQAVTLGAGDRIYLYSDGVTETMNTKLVQFGDDNLLRCLGGTLGRPLHESVQLLLDELTAWRGDAAAADDLSVLAVELAS